LEGGGWSCGSLFLFCESILGFVVVFDHNKYRKAHNEKVDDGVDKNPVIDPNFSNF